MRQKNKDRWSPNLERLLFSVLFLLYVNPHNVSFEYKQLLFLSKSDVWQYTPVHHKSRYDGREFLSLLQPVLHSDTERNISFLCMKQNNLDLPLVSPSDMLGIMV